MTMNAEQLSHLVVQAMTDLKAQDVRVLDVRSMSGVTDFMVIASGTSNRQVAAIANNVVDEVKARGLRPLGMEGQSFGEWVLVDLGDVVAHVMQPQVRAFYQLEKLWSEVDREAALQRN